MARKSLRRAACQCGYLGKAFALDVGLYPFQPVRVLFLTHPFVNLRAQLLRTLQGKPEVAVIGVIFWSVLENLVRIKKGRKQHKNRGKPRYYFSVLSEKSPQRDKGLFRFAIEIKLRSIHLQNLAQGTHTLYEQRVAGYPLHRFQEEAGEGHSFAARVQGQFLWRNPETSHYSSRNSCLTALRTENWLIRLVFPGVPRNLRLFGKETILVSRTDRKASAAIVLRRFASTSRRLIVCAESSYSEPRQLVL